MQPIDATYHNSRNTSPVYRILLLYHDNRTIKIHTWFRDGSCLWCPRTFYSALIVYSLIRKLSARNLDHCHRPTNVHSLHCLFTRPVQALRNGITVLLCSSFDSHSHVYAYSHRGLGPKTVSQRTKLLMVLSIFIVFSVALINWNFNFNFNSIFYAPCVINMRA